MKIQPVQQITKNGITLTVDFIADGEVFYVKHREKTNPNQKDWETFIGGFRVPVDVWEQQTAA